MKRICLLLSLLFCSSILVAQRVIFVSADAGKVGKGTIDAPYKTIEAALEQASHFVGTDTVSVYVQPGFYPLEKAIRIEKGLTAPLVIQGDAENMPEISGAIKLTSWEKTAQGWWKTHIDEVARYGLKIEQFYMNDKRAIRARTPDNDWFQIEGTDELIHSKGAGRLPEYATLCIHAKPEDLKSLNGLSEGELNNVVVMCYHHWDNTRKYMSFVNPDSGYFYLTGEGMQPWNPITKGSRFILENYKQAMTVEGEWFLEPSGDLYYIPREGETMDTAVGYVPVLSTLLALEGEKNNPVSNVTFRNLSFAHTAYVMPKKGNEPTQAAAPVDAAIHLDFADNVRFENCEVKHTGNYAVWFRKACTNASLEHSFLTDLGAGGVKIGEYETPEPDCLTKYVTVNNTIIQRTGFVFPCGVGIVIFNASDNKITHNEISDLAYTGVSVGWAWGYGKSYATNNEIAYNHIHHIGWGELSDMGAVYTLGISPGTHIHNNVIHHVYSYDYGGWGLYTDEGSSHIVLENNLVYGCKSGGFHQHYGKENNIRNNIFAFNQSQQLQLTKVEEHQSFSFTSNIILADHGAFFSGPWDKANINMDYNCYWDMREEPVDRFLDYTFDAWKQMKEKHTILENPGFEDPLQLNFQFKNQKVIRKIGFRPFNYKEAGVYGSNEWKQKALLPKEREAQFDRMIRQREKSVSLLFDK